jgi:C4-dicarboxylate-specific signal transduction histidine kinase
MCLPMRGDGDAVSGWVGLGRRVEAAAQTPLAAGLADELSQPLTAVGTTARAVSRLLKAGEAEQSELLEAFEQIDRQVVRASEIIRRLRDLLSVGQRHRSRTQLHVLIREVVDTLAAEFKAARIRVRLQTSKKQPAVAIDDVQISLVVQNLLRNALEAMQQGPVSGRILTIATQNNREQVQISISDRGPNVNPALTRRLFEPFFSTKPQGLGMGLALSRTIIQAHGGELSAEANPDRGMTFTFSLPLSQETP